MCPKARLESCSLISTIFEEDKVLPHGMVLLFWTEKLFLPEMFCQHYV